MGGSTCRPALRKNSSSGAVPLGTRTGQPRPQAEAGDAKHRDRLSKILRPKLSRDLTMTADASPGERPVPLGTRTGPPGRPATASQIGFDRAPGEILPFQLFVETVYFPSKARRAGFLAAFCDANPAKAPVGPPGTRKLVLVRQQERTALREWRLTKAKITPAKHPTGAPHRPPAERPNNALKKLLPKTVVAAQLLEPFGSRS